MTAAATIAQQRPAFLAGLLRQMLRIRRFEEKAAQLYGLRKIGGFCHLYIGQEAVAAGAIAAIDLSKDYVFTAYRDHGHALACGAEAGAVMAELFGKATGCCKGKGGSMHLFDVAHHFFGGNGIVGAHVPLAAGAALAIKYRRLNGVVLCFFGDGAIHQGTFHETLNLAKIWNLPILFICENNQYGMGTFYKRVSAVEDLSLLGASYDIPGRQINGMDVLEVYREVASAAAHARGNGLPMLLEARTYRYRGHSMSDPARYRTKEELETYRQQDPILMLRTVMEREGVLDQRTMNQLDEQCKQEVERAVEFAEKSPQPALEQRFEDVYA
jgi:pyruvate dehydrogenase E1 component alpha subunit